MTDTIAAMAQRRRVLGLSIKDLLVLAAYVALLCLAVPHYQPWEDEGRAWVNARFFGFFELIFHILRYEGHPAVWYVLLWPLAHLHMPFGYLNSISAACGVTGIYFLLRYSPFPFYLRAILPFGFALAYENAVVARSYCLFPLLGFMVAHQYRQKIRRPVHMAVVLALLANLSLHGAIVALAFGTSYALDLWREHRAAPRDSVSGSSIRQARLGALIFAGSLVFLLAVLWPPRDLVPPVGPTVTRILKKVSPVNYRSSPTAAPRRYVHLVRTTFQTPAQFPDTTAALNLGIGRLFLRTRLRTVFVYPIATSGLLALLFQALVFCLLWRRGKSILIAGQLLLCAFLVQIYLRLWHTNLVWVTLILLLWAVWDEHEPPGFTLQNVVSAVFTLICLLQLPWTLSALRFERTHSTYPAHAAADYIQSLPPGRRIDGFDHSFTVLPWMIRYPFHMQAEVLEVPAALADRPDVILFRESTVTPLQLAQLNDAGYRNTRTFCGTPFFPNQPLVPLCLIFLEKP